MEQHLRLQNQLSDLAAIESALETLVAGKAITPEVGIDTRLLLEEVFTNIVKYAHADGRHDHPVEVRLTVEADWLECEFIDAGSPFDPFAESVDQLDKPFAERADGLMGVPLIRALTDERGYSRIDGRNHLFLRKRLKPMM